MLTPLVALFIIFLSIYWVFNKRMIREVQLQQPQMLPQQIVQAQRMLKRQWYRVHPGWRLVHIVAIGLNGLSMLAVVSQILILANLVTLPQNLIVGQMRMLLWSAIGFIVAGTLLAVGMWHYNQMLLATHQTDIYTPPRTTIRTGWWLRIICQCLLVGIAVACTQTQIKVPTNHAAVTIDPTITLAKQTIASNNDIATTAKENFWQLHIGRENAAFYRDVESQLGSPSRILALVKSGELDSGIATWQNFANTNQRLTLVFKNGRVIAKLCDQIAVARAHKPSVFDVDFALTSTDAKELNTQFGGYNWVAGTRDVVWAQFFSDQYTPIDNFNYTFGYTGLTGKKYHATSFTFNMDVQSADDIYSDQPVAKHKGEVNMMGEWYTRVGQVLTQQLQKGNIKSNQVKQGRQALAALN